MATIFCVENLTKRTSQNMKKTLPLIFKKTPYLGSAIKLVILSLVISTTYGCSSTTFYEQKQKKQFFQKNSESNYLLCKRCLTHTEINFNQPIKEESCCITK
jgi:hypothetical protein